MIIFFSNLRIMRYFLRKFDLNISFCLMAIQVETVIRNLISRNARFLGLIFRNNLRIIFYGDGAFANIGGQLVLEHAHHIVAIATIVPEAPVIPILGPLASAGRHRESTSIRFCYRDGTNQLLQICHLVFNHFARHIHAGFTKGQRIMND